MDSILVYAQHVANTTKIMLNKEEQPLSRLSFLFTHTFPDFLED